MTTHDDNEDEASNGATEITTPSDTRDTPSTDEQHQRGKPSHATPTPPPRQANRQQRPKRTKTETQTAIAPPHLSNERGAERYDDRAKRAERIASRHAVGKHVREDTWASKTWQGDDRTRSHEQRDDDNDDAPPGLSKERGEERNENGPAVLSNSFSSLIAHPDREAEPYYPSPAPRRFPQLAANRREAGGRRYTHSIHMKYENPISE